mgnify:CR=1 FL=1
MNRLDLCRKLQTRTFSCAASKIKPGAFGEVRLLQIIQEVANRKVAVSERMSMQNRA